MITKSRADEIKAAWLKRNGFTESSHPNELKAFLEGMRAMAGEWIASKKSPADATRSNHLLNYQPPGDDEAGYPFN